MKRYQHEHRHTQVDLQNRPDMHLGRTRQHINEFQGFLLQRRFPGTRDLTAPASLHFGGCLGILTFPTQDFPIQQVLLGVQKQPQSLELVAKLVVFSH